MFFSWKLELFIPYTSSPEEPVVCDARRKSRSSLLVLHFCNAEEFLMLAQSISSRRSRAITNDTRSLPGFIR